MNVVILIVIAESQKLTPVLDALFLLTLPIWNVCRISRYKDAAACDLTEAMLDPQCFNKRRQRSAQWSLSSSNKAL